MTVDNKADRAHRKLLKLHAEVGKRFDRMEAIGSLAEEELFRLQPSVSAWSVANQLHHTASSTGLMLLAVERIAHRKQPAIETGSLNAVGRLVLTTGRFPRGRGKAPAASVPPENVTRSDIERVLTRSRAVHDRSTEYLGLALETGWRAPHPYFGDLGAGNWLSLASIHADHHFRIIEDIRSAG